MRITLCLLSLAACTSSPAQSSSPGELQMNDVSVMFPLAQSSSELASSLAPSAAAVGGVLLPESIAGSADVGVAYAELRVVAFRFDPCFGQVGTIDPATCQNQLRVVFQPLSMATDATATTANDEAIHAFYALTRDQLLAAVDDMITARQAENGDADIGPLAPHPVIAQQGLGGALAQAYDHIITTYAGQSNLVRVTSMQLELVNMPLEPSNPTSTPTGTASWNFDSFDVADGAVTPRAIPTLPDSPTLMAITAAVDPLAASGSPATTSSDNIAVLEDTTMATAATATVRQAAFDAALRIENPHDNSPDTIDCASCHLAQPARQLVGDPLGMTAVGDASAFVPDASIPLADLAQTTQLVGSDEILNIHAFSYRNASPMINQRVINDTAANVAFISQLLQAP